MKWQVPNAGIRKLSRTKNNALLVIRYPDSLIEYRTNGELVNEITVKVEGLELSHAIKLDENRYI